MTIDLSALRQPLIAIVQGASRGIGLALVQHLSANDQVTVVYAAARDAPVTEAVQTLADDSRSSRCLRPRRRPADYCPPSADSRK